VTDDDPMDELEQIADANSIHINVGHKKQNGPKRKTKNYMNESRWKRQLNQYKIQRKKGKPHGTK
jgi:hypothetical protein